MPTPEREQVSRIKFVGRKVSRVITQLVLPTTLQSEYEDGEDGIEKARKLH